MDNGKTLMVQANSPQNPLVFAVDTMYFALIIYYS